MKRYDMTDELPKRYAVALTGAKTLDELSAAVAAFAYVARDAAAAVNAMHPNDFAGFRAGLELERNGMFAGESWNARFEAIMMPAVMVQVALVAIEFKVPWGLAFNRCADVGLVTERDGFAHWIGVQKHGS